MNTGDIVKLFRSQTQEHIAAGLERDYQNGKFNEEEYLYLKILNLACRKNKIIGVKDGKLNSGDWDAL